jgi:single-stranded DNA-specific DHH superfamily exonuclease
MEKDIKVSCPCCGAILFVDRINGKITETRKPLVERSTGDRLEDAFLKSKQDKETRESIFENMKEIQERRKKLSEELFKASLEDAQKNKDASKPPSIFDSD